MPTPDTVVGASVDEVLTTEDPPGAAAATVGLPISSSSNNNNNRRKEKLQLCIVVRDTGSGIRSCDLDTVMAPFGQVHAGDEARGTGLGLPLSAKMAARIGGSLVLESEWSVGTTVSVTIPVQPAPIPTPRHERKLSCLLYTSPSPRDRG